MLNLKRKTPCGNRGFSNTSNVNSAQNRQGKQGFFDRARLPSPNAYLERIGAKFRRSSNTAIVVCPFHGEKRASLLLDLTDGHFKCLACGAKGRDVLAFHQLLTGLSFKEAAIALGAWGGNHG